MKLLFATDGFEAATYAAELIHKVADRERVEVTVISVNPRGMPDLEHALLMLDAPELRRKDTLGLVDYWVEWFRSNGFTATGRLGEGRPGEEIVRAVEDGWFDLTVLGSGHHSWLGQRLIGSVSSHVLHTSPTSVLIAHHTPTANKEIHVLAAVDGSRGCEFASRTARGLVSPPHTEVRVVSCFAPLTAFAGPGSVGVVPVPSSGANDKAAAEAARITDHFAGQFTRDGYATFATVLEGQPVERILKEADSWPADLVVVGSRGLGPFKRTLLGSVSDQIVRHAPATLVGRHLA